MIETDSWAVTNGVVECSGIWKEQGWKTANEKSGKRYVEALLSKWAQTLKIYVMSASRAYSVREAFNHQVNKMTCPMEVNQTLPPAIPVLVQWTHE